MAGMASSTPPQWVEYETSDGVPYFYHVGDGVTQWERPDRAAVVTARSLGVAYKSTLAAPGDDVPQTDATDTTACESAGSSVQATPNHGGTVHHSSAMSTSSAESRASSHRPSPAVARVTRARARAPGSSAASEDKIGLERARTAAQPRRRREAAARCTSSQAVTQVAAHAVPSGSAAHACPADTADVGDCAPRVAARKTNLSYTELLDPRHAASRAHRARGAAPAMGGADTACSDGAGTAATAQAASWPRAVVAWSALFDEATAEARDVITAPPRDAELVPRPSTAMVTAERTVPQSSPGDARSTQAAHTSSTRPTARPRTPPARARGTSHSFPEHNLYAIYARVVQWLDARSAGKCLRVCRGWARVGTSDTFLRGVYERMVAGGAVRLAGVALDGSKEAMREAIATALQFEGKWGRSMNRNANNGFRINVAVRFKPVNVVASVAAEERAAKVEARRQRLLKEAAAAAANDAARTNKDGKKGAWSTTPRFRDPELERRKREEKEALQRADESELIADRLLDKHLWSHGTVTVGSGGMVARKFDCFSRVFNDGHSQRAVYDRVGAPLVRSCLLGYDTTLFVYGQTGSGKTYTVFGPPGCYSYGRVGRGDVPMYPDWGLLPRIVDGILRHRERGTTMRLTASAVEVYQDGLFDLLNNRKPIGVVDLDAKPRRNRRQRVRPHQRAGAGAGVGAGAGAGAGAGTRKRGRQGRARKQAAAGFALDGQHVVVISGLRTLLAVAMRVEATRVAGSTKMNERSSRSHAVVVLTLTQTREATMETMQSKLLLVDLAGSERIKKSGSTGVRASEAKQINSSLTALGRAITSLAEQKPHVPYRDSTLTKLLSQSLGGNSRTGLVVTCSQDPGDMEETVATLRFGERTGLVQNWITRSSRDLASMIQDTRTALSAARRTLRELEARGQGQRWGVDRLGNPIGAATRQRYQDAVANRDRLAAAASAAGLRVTEAIGAAGGRRDTADVVAAIAAQVAVQRELTRAQGTVTDLERMGVVIAASGLYTSTVAQINALEGQLRNLGVGEQVPP